MILSDTASEIQKGLWMIVPFMVGKYLKASNEMLMKNPTMLNGKEMQGGLIREVIGPDGDIVQYAQDSVPHDSVGIVRCIGSMYKYGGWFNWGSDELVAFAMEFDRHPNIVGQVWQDDSGGGTISSVAPYLEFLKNKQKPVVALADTCGSANYYKNCGVDHLMAENDVSAMFGSIGVMIQFYDYSKMLEENGIVEHIINADQSSEKNKAFELALKGQYKKIKQEYLNPAAIKFQDHVKANRPKLNEDVEGILSGKMFYAEEALEYGMIDSIGSLEAAIDRVKFLASARLSITR